MAMTHHVELPDHVYQIAERAAAREGLSPEEWIVATVSRAGAPLPADDNTGEDRPNRETLARYIGAFDSSQVTRDPRYRTEFGDIVAEKLRKQGLDIS
jgi:hypothetical protein